jgi:CubicO group peptidase (beta-lactamase class C family)
MSSAAFRTARRVDRIACTVAALLLVGACGGQARQASVRAIEKGLLPPVGIAGRAPVPWSLLERMRSYRVPGVSIAVIDGGELVWSQAYGVTDATTHTPVTRDTRFQAASISKSIAAVAVLRLVERGKLALDDDVNAKLASWKVPDNEFTRQHRVTLRLLLSHGAGFNPHYATQFPLDDVPTLLQVLTASHPRVTEPTTVEYVPGTRFNYSSAGYGVIQQLLVDVTGEPYGDLVAREVFAPLGMTHSFAEQPPTVSHALACATAHDQHGIPYSGRWHALPELTAGGVWSTPEDLARFVLAIQAARTGRSAALSADAANQMLTLQNAVWALGFHVQGDGVARNFSHTGHSNGFRAVFIGFFDTGQGAVVMTNGDSDSGQLVWEIVRSIATAYHWTDYQMKQRTLVPSDPRSYDAYLGDYETDSATFTVSRDGDHLFVHADPLGPDKVELYPEGEDRFFVLVDDVVFAFTRTADRVTGLTVRPPDQVITARKRP